MRAKMREMVDTCSASSTINIGDKLTLGGTVIDRVKMQLLIADSPVDPV